ncbi:bifunctional folylpolyglutamate synthase/dihydrofolate synthase [Spirochaeta dissipatitropha]
MPKLLPTVKEVYNSLSRESSDFRGLSLDEGFLWIESLTNFESRKIDSREYRLDRMRHILSVLGNPENDLQFIHIAGSKGKGSTAAMTAYILDAAGYKTALYTSPHVVDYRERFRIINNPCPETILEAAVNRLYRETVIESGSLFNSNPTTFELLTAVFLLMSRDTGCDYAVLETGLGGRLDATNVIQSPQAAICTSIELEHTEILGNTLELIASEKAGIVKKSCPVFTGNLPPQADEVFAAKAIETGSTLYRIRDEVRITESTEINTADLCFKDGFTIHVRLQLLGSVQFENAALACLTLRTLFPDMKSTIYEKGLGSARIPGRMQLLDSSPPIIIDGGHTPSSIERNLSAVKAVMPEGGAVIFGAVEGKNIEAMAELLCRLFKTAIICRPGTFRPSDPEKTAEIFSRFLPPENIDIIEDGFEALQKARKIASGINQGVCVIGSFFLAGKILKAYKENSHHVS